MAHIINVVMAFGLPWYTVSVLFDAFVYPFCEFIWALLVFIATFGTRYTVAVSSVRHLPSAHGSQGSGYYVNNNNDNIAEALGKYF